MSYKIPISYIRQYLFCPRIPFFLMHAFPSPVETIWMTQGNNYHKKAEKLFKRRTLARFNLQSAKKEFRIPVDSDSLGITGIIDLALEDDNNIYPIEIKISGKKPVKSHILQLTAYGLCLAETKNKEFSFGLLYYQQQNKIHKIDYREENKETIIDIVAKLRENYTRGIIPDSSAGEAKCGQCEWYNYCNDR